MKEFYATGRRKNSIARVRVFPGSGEIKVNKKTLIGHFKRETLKMVIEQPLEMTETLDKFDIIANVKGGGLSGQAGAMRLGVSRALIKYDEELRPILKASPRIDLPDEKWASIRIFLDLEQALNQLDKLHHRGYSSLISKTVCNKIDRKDVASASRRTACRSRMM